MVNRPIPSALRVAQEANATAYRRAVQGGAIGECWDYLVLTATNEKQAEGYRQELALRQRPVGPAGAFFPAFQKFLVVADPPGPRIGSGGATLHALRALSAAHGVPLERLPDLRILLIHSGGLSQRLPAYSPLGKIFSPLPLLRPDGQVATLFDHLYVTLAGLPERLGTGMLVLSGDVFLLFDHRHVSPPPAGVTALTFRVEPDVAAAHGVFVTDGGAIRKTLQKVSPQQMRVEGATDAHGKVLIDTGLFFFDPERTKRLGALAGLKQGKKPAGRALHERHRTPLDLYVDVVMALSGGGRKPGTSPMLKELVSAFRGTDFRAMVLDGEFLHLGTTQQFRDAMTGRSTSPVAELLQQNVLVHAPHALPADCRAFHAAFLGAGAGRPEVGAGSLVESSILGAGSRVGANCVVSQALVDGRPLHLTDGLLFFQVPLRAKQGRAHAQVLCGVGDDFKGRFAAGECRFLNAPLDRWLELHRVTPDDLWPGVLAADRTLWTARLFPATAERSGAGAVEWFQSLTAAPARTMAGWRRATRYSMSMILEHADPAAMIEHREAVTALVQAGYLLDSIRADEDKSIDETMPHYATAAAYRLATERLAAYAGTADGTPTDLLHQARAAWSVSQLARRPNHPDVEFARAHAEPFAAKAFAKIAEASESASRSVRVIERGDDGLAGLRAGRTVTATSPVRLDLAGGWSDTPPYCFERGGHVVNVAVDLDGRSPIVATVRTLAEPKIVLDTRDLGQKAELTAIEGTVDVRDPFALHKVALQMMGLVPPVGVKRRGAVGLEVTTESRLPKGSGLGTSSILAATLLAALNRLTGQKVSPAGLFDQTLLLEQRLSTGGGWQDQVGGVVGGIKSTVTAAGLPQRPEIEQLKLPDPILDAFEERLVVYYSGQQRLARDILRRVMGRWLSREPAITVLMDRLNRCSADLRAALLKGRWPRVADEIDRYWRIKKELYPGSTTPSVDVMMLELRDHYAAASLAGAGGGGFAYFFCKDGRQAKRLTELLAERSARPGSLGAVYPVRINRRGLVVKST